MAERQLSAGAAAALSGTTTTGTAIVYPSADSDPWLVAYYTQLGQIAKLLGGALNAFRVYYDDANATTIGIAPGVLADSGTVRTYNGGTANLSAHNNDTAYVWAYVTGGAVAIGFGADGSGWPGTAHIKLASVVLSAGAITAITDLRSAAYFTLA
jgi:hypothetical protein